MRSLVVLLFVAVLAACGSSSKVRADGSYEGTMTTGSLPLVSIDGKAMRMAPGARIMSPANTSITPNQVPAGSRVRYTLDASGQVSQVWLLPPAR